MQFGKMIIACLFLMACNQVPKEVASEVPSNMAASAGVIAPNAVDNVANAPICPAKDLQYLVGQSRSLLHTMRFGSEVRIEEPGVAYTEEFSPSRTRIIIGANDKIIQVICG